MNRVGFGRLAAFGLGICLAAAGCEKQSTPPASPSSGSSTQASSQPNDNEVAALRSMAAKKSPNNPQGLPAGHPPIPSRNPAGAAASKPADSLSFTAPPDWKAEKPASAMRKAQYTLPHAEGDSEDGELVVFYFGFGEGGNVTDNLERWRSQFTQPDGAPLAHDAATEERYEANGLKVVLLDVSGRFAPGAMPGMAKAEPRDNYRMLAAVIQTPMGPWFVKATGPAKTMEKQHDAVKAFIASAKR